MTQKPLMIDLFSGLGGWADGGIAEGYSVVGFDIERHEYGDAKYPAQLVLQDVLTLHGRQFKDAALIVASPPCQEFSYMAMPWSRGKAIAAEYRSGKRDVKKLTALFDACFRIQREAIEASGHFIPLVVENVRGAIPWVGRSRWNFGSYHLWGDVPALMPIVQPRQVMKQGIAHRPNGETNFHGIKGIPHRPTGHWTNPDENGTKYYGGPLLGVPYAERAKNGSCRTGPKTKSRKAASAAIAKIPFPLARHIAQAWKPKESC